jgi:hypothetical protein
MTIITAQTKVGCPTWCNVSQTTHQRELQWEGHAVHWSDSRAGEGWEIRHISVTDAEGTDQHPPRVHVTTSGALTLGAAESLALTLLAAYEEATG